MKIAAVSEDDIDDSILLHVTINSITLRSYKDQTAFSYLIVKMTITSTLLTMCIKVLKKLQLDKKCNKTSFYRSHKLALNVSYEGISAKIICLSLD